jgi:hypothetical protein
VWDSRRWIVPIFALAGLLLIGLGLGLLITFAFPEVTCSGDACLIGPNALALPMLAVGVALEIGAGACALGIRSATPRTAKH